MACRGPADFPPEECTHDVGVRGKERGTTKTSHVRRDKKDIIKTDNYKIRHNARTDDEKRGIRKTNYMRRDK